MGFAPPERRKQLSDRTWCLIVERNELRVRMLSYTDDYLEEELRTRHRAIKKSARADRRAAVNKLAVEAEAAAQRGDSGVIYKCVRSLSGEKSRVAHGVRYTHGTMLTGDQDRLRRWHQHFSGDDVADDGDGEVTKQPVDGEVVFPPSTQKIVDAIVRLNAGK